MCGRFTQKYTWEELHQLYRLTQPARNLRPRYNITAVDRPILTIAGLWSEWRGRVNDETLTTCTMVITEANSFISAIHDRMPVLLDRESADAWLSGEAGLGLLKPAPDDALRMWPVSRRVNK